MIKYYYIALGITILVYYWAIDKYCYVSFPCIILLDQINDTVLILIDYDTFDNDLI